MNSWRLMAAADMPAVAAISDAVHGDYTECAPVYAERLDLYPAGCWLLEKGGDALGYCISHPWHGDRPPVLGALIASVPLDADRYYLHDLALLPQARGIGAAGKAVQLVLRQAQDAGFDKVTLTAVNGADTFWRKQGFAPMPNRPDGYGENSLSMERAGISL